MVAKQNLCLYYENALALHLPATYSSDLELINIYLGKRNYYFLATITPFNDGASSFLSKNKYLLNKTLAQANFPVPHAIAMSKEEYSAYPLEELIAGLNFPLVVKPLNLGRGRGVLSNIKNLSTLSNYLNQSFNEHPVLQIEEYHGGLKEYRVLIFRSKVIGVVERFAAKIVGNGQNSIAELIDLANEERARMNENEKFLAYNPMIVDEEYKNCLSDQGLDLDTVVPEGKTIQLCYTVNTGRGGDIFSHGKKIHPQNAKLLCQIAKKVGLNYVGLDVLCEDINQSFTSTKWLILEANFNPDITLHEVPPHGESVNVTRKVLKYLIFRHPFSYFSHLCAKGKTAIYLKVILVIALVLLLSFLAS
ncbi:UDP-N-acetylmuramyl peptide synthase [Legionella sp.]|uniref:UDP-N-acetylmuramyl peptide synthase n=1 Tax=Legionella sp. TaxID=459 RepID=UPI000CAEE3B0|nr:UDP-N-acetylmuramyl peptide synthase [Legionella sp.]PJE07346.1 MAG: UDP-N-acetylmuramyl peptide synthase [Legionella sp.]